MGVIECRDSASLTLEALAQFRVLGQVLGEDFNGDRAVQASVAGAVDFAHTARAYGADDLVGSEASSWQERHAVSDYKPQIT